MRRTIADRLGESYREAVHVTLSREVAAEALLVRVEAAGNGDGPAPSLLDGLIDALSTALDEHPSFNATFEDGTHRLYAEHNVGVAVAIEDGLVTPVLPDVGSKSLADIVGERRDLTERVQAGEYTMRTFQGGTITVSNLGPLGVDSFTPVINPPEVAILGVGRVRERAVPDGDAVAVQRRLTLDLSFDHRVVDGADAARFLESLAAAVERE